jgi:DnaJ-class molecular chaperone
MKVRTRHQIPSDGWVPMRARCWHCSGQGKVEETTCAECSGTGVMEVEVSLDALVDYVGDAMMKQILRANPSLGR